MQAHGLSAGLTPRPARAASAGGPDQAARRLGGRRGPPHL